MRISVEGENFAAEQFRGYVRTQGFAISSKDPHYTVTFQEDAKLEGQNHFIVRGIACPLERLIAEHIHELTKKDFICQRAGALRSDQDLSIIFAPADANAVAQGAFRGLLALLLPKVIELNGEKTVPAPKSSARCSIFRRIWIWIVGE